MEQHDIQRLTNQMRAALLNRPIATEQKTTVSELQELQSAIEYLAACLQETHQFLGDLCAGNLEVDPPGRHNFIAGDLKELHSILKHLTWQTAQVAGGDYSQKVRFLGAFSDSFNEMTRQLKEREAHLSAKSRALRESMDLLRSVLDGQRDWVVVIDEDDGQVIYTNLSAKRKFYDMDRMRATCPDYGLLLDQLIHTPVDQENLNEREHHCQGRGTTLLIRSFPIEWNERRAVVHCISDITDAREKQAQLQDLAYRDTLTGTYNRRYCEEALAKLMKKKSPFSLVLMDLDGLKQVNDQLGHIFGDEYINTVVEISSAHIRARDRLCRIGGDEFLLILPNCSEQSGEGRMVQICAQLASIQRAYPLVISYGILYVAADASPVSPEELLGMVDARMYAMKQLHKQQTRA